MTGMDLGSLVVTLSINSSQFTNEVKTAQRSLEDFANRAISIGKTMTKAFTLPFVGLSAYSVKAFGDFDQAMTESLAILGDVDSALKEQMILTARGISRKTITSAEELARSYYYLASAGFSAEQSLASLDVVNDFAIAGTFSMTQATDLLTDSLSALGLASSDATVQRKNLVRVSDVLTAANVQSNASVQDFAEALTNKAAAAMRLLNKDVEEGVAVLSAFADQGTKGLQAGTKFAIMSGDLQTAITRNGEAWKSFGLSVYDSSGKMLSYADIIAQLERVLFPMSDEMKKATALQLGFREASWNTLQTLLGTSDKIRRYETELRTANEETKRLADMVMTSFNSQMKILGNNFKDVARTIGAFFAPAVLKVNRILMQSIKIWDNLGNSTQRTILIFTTFSAALGPALIAFGMLLKLGAKLQGVLVGLFSLSKVGLGSGALAAVAPFMILAAKVALVLGVVTALIWAIVGTDGLRAAWGKGIEAVKSFVSFSTGFLMNFRENLGILMEWFGANWRTLLHDASQLFVRTLQNSQHNLAINLRVWTQLFGAFGGWLTNLFLQIFDIDFMGILTSALSKAFEKVVDWGKRIAEVLKAAFTLNFDELKKQLSGAFSSGFDKGAASLDILGTWSEIIQEGWADMKTPWEGFESGLKDLPKLNLEWEKPNLTESLGEGMAESLSIPKIDFPSSIPAILQEADSRAVETGEREVEFEERALNRFSLEGLTGFGAPHKIATQQVEDKGVEGKLQELIQLTRERQEFVLTD